MKFCESRELIDRHSYVAQYISLALLSNGITALLGSDDLLAAFFSGVAFAWDSHFNKQTSDSVFSAVIDLLFNVAIFVFVVSYRAAVPSLGANLVLGGLDAVFFFFKCRDHDNRLATPRHWHPGATPSPPASDVATIQMDS